LVTRFFCWVFQIRNAIVTLIVTFDRHIKVNLLLQGVLRWLKNDLSCAKIYLMPKSDDFLAWMSQSCTFVVHVDLFLAVTYLKGKIIYIVLGVSGEDIII